MDVCRLRCVFIFDSLLNQSRIQQLKLGHPGGMVQQSMIQGQQQTRIVQQIQGNRIIQTVANPNQPGQPIGVGQSVLHQQLQQPNQQPGTASVASVPGQPQPPPPPYPEPPPPYPGSQPGAMPGASTVNQVSDICLFVYSPISICYLQVRLYVY